MILSPYPTVTMDKEILLAILRKKRKKLQNKLFQNGDSPVVFTGVDFDSKKPNIYKVDKAMDLESTKGKMLKQKKEELSKYLIAKSINMGYYLITPLLIGLFIGYWLDKVFNTKPFFLLLLLSVGVISSFYILWKIVKELE